MSDLTFLMQLALRISHSLSLASGATIAFSIPVRFN